MLNRTLCSHLVRSEMERDAVISHGASSVTKERLMLTSDAYQTVFCKTCGNFAVHDATTNRYKTCRLCGKDEFGRVTIPYAYKLLIHLLGGAGISLSPVFLSSDDYMEKIFSQRGIGELGDINDIKAQLEEADETLEEEQQEIAEEMGEIPVMEDIGDIME